MEMVFVADVAFPYGEAFSSRVRNFMKVFSMIGYKIHLIALRGNDENTDELYNVEYTSYFVDDPQNILTLSGVGTSKPYIPVLRKIIHDNKIDLIFSSSMPFIVDKIKKISDENGIPYIMEQCEWYDSSSFKFGKINPYFREHNRIINNLNQKCDGAIAISTFFKEYFHKKNINVVRIPTILDMRNISPRIHVTEKSKLNITFAGSLGKGKENLKPMLQAVNEINADRTKVLVNIYGASKEQVIDNIGGSKELLDRKDIIVHGRIPQEEVEGKVREADFTFIIRPNRRSSNAGFSTKLAESFAVGTPVIANDTGDIASYLQFGENGFIVSEDNPDSIKKVLEVALHYDKDKVEKMRINARKTAEKYFDYRNYVDVVQEFINEIIKQKEDD